MTGDVQRPGKTRSFPGTTQTTWADASGHPTSAVFLVSETGSLILPSSWNGPRIRLLIPDPVATRFLPHRPPPTHIRVALCHQRPAAALGHQSTSQSQAEPVQSTHAECLSSGRKVWLVSFSVQLCDPVFNASQFWPCSTVSDLLSHAFAQASPVSREPNSSHCPQPLDFVVASRQHPTPSNASVLPPFQSPTLPSNATLAPFLRIHFSSFAPDAQSSAMLDADHLDSGVSLTIQSLLQDVVAQPGRSYRERDSTTTASHVPLFKPIVVRTSFGPRSGWYLRLVDGVLLAIQASICHAGCSGHAEEVDVATLDPDKLSMPSPLRSFFKSSSGSSNGSNSSEGSHGLASPGPQRVANAPKFAPPASMSRQRSGSGVEAGAASRSSSISRAASPILDLMALSTSIPAQAAVPPAPSPVNRVPGRPASRGRNISRGGGSRADVAIPNSAPAFLDAPYSFTLPTSATLHSSIRSSSSGPSLPVALPFSTTLPDSAPVRRSHSTSELFRIARRQRELLANMVQRPRTDTIDSSHSSLGQLPPSDNQPFPRTSRTEYAARPPTVNVVAATPRSSQPITQPETRVSTLSASGEIDLSSLDDLFTAARRGFHTSLATASFRAVPPATDEPTGDPTQGFGPRNVGPRRRKDPPEPGMRCAKCSRTESPEWRRGPDGQRNLCNACGLKYARTLRSAATTETVIPGSSAPSSAATSSSTLATSSFGGNSTPQQLRDSAISSLSAPSTTNSTRGSTWQLGPTGNGRLRMAEIDSSSDDTVDPQPPIGTRPQTSPSPQPRPGA